MKPLLQLIVVSDRAAQGVRPDATAPLLQPHVAACGFSMGEVRVVPDEIPAIEAALRAAIRSGGLVLTTGGTGPALRDVTPEATRLVIQRELPGFGEAMRMASFHTIPTALGSRAIAGLAGAALVVNLPGSPKGALDCFQLIAPAALHVLRVVGGEAGDCARP